jgi:hypothetical protein
MKKNIIKYNKIDENMRNVKVKCIGCGKMLKFLIKEGALAEGEGVIAENIPGAVCPDCINVLVNRVPDPPGLICIKNLNPILVREIIESFDFLLPRERAVDFFRSLFPRE